MKRTFGITAVMLLAVLAGCTANDATNDPSTARSVETAIDEYGQQPIPTGAGGAPRGGAIDPDQIDTTSADAVADAVVLTTNRWDTRIDNSRQDATRRALPWLGDQYADLAQQALPGGGGQDWNELFDHDGYTTVAVEHVQQGGTPSDTDTTAYRIRNITITPHGADGWTGTPETVTDFITLARTSPADPWQVVAITTS